MKKRIECDMDTIDRRALWVQREDLVKEIQEANLKKSEELARRDAVFGADRPMIGSYLENIALPGLFGFDMNEYFRNPAFAFETDLRHKLFWLDNSHDDTLATLETNVGSMYFDMTLFGLEIQYQANGVPEFSRHPLTDNFDLGLLRPFDFFETGEMPMIHSRYLEMSRLSEEWYDGQVKVLFPMFNRGPLDIVVQLRDYSRFIEDCFEKPDKVHQLFAYIVRERHRYNGEVLSTFRNAEECPGFVADDWVNIPFISPDIFNTFVVPAYQAIQDNEGVVRNFHTCGVFTPVVKRLMSVFPGIESLDVSGWNDFVEVDCLVDRNVSLLLNFINTFVLCSPKADHEAKLREILQIRRGRKIALNVQSIVKLFDNIDESIIRMNQFIDLARRRLA